MLATLPGAAQGLGSFKKLIKKCWHTRQRTQSQEKRRGPTGTAPEQAGAPMRSSGSFFRTSVSDTQVVTSSWLVRGSLQREHRLLWSTSKKTHNPGGGPGSRESTRLSDEKHLTALMFSAHSCTVCSQWHEFFSISAAHLSADFGSVTSYRKVALHSSSTVPLETLSCALDTVQQDIHTFISLISDSPIKDIDELLW